MFSGSKLSVWSLISYRLAALFTSNSAAILLLWCCFSYIFYSFFAKILAKNLKKVYIMHHKKSQKGVKPKRIEISKESPIFQFI